MYIIYREHMFLYIFPCFNWDSSFVTEVENVPCKLKHFVKAAPAVWGNKRDFSYWFALKKKNVIRKGGKNLILIFQSLTHHFDEFTSWLRVQERTSWCWLVTFKDGSGCGQIKRPQWGFPSEGRCSLPFPEHGSSRRSGIRDCEAVAASRLKRRTQCDKSHNQLLHKASVQHPDWELFLFHNSCTDWEYAHIKPYASNTWECRLFNFTWTRLR